METLLVTHTSRIIDILNKIENVYKSDHDRLAAYSQFSKHVNMTTGCISLNKVLNIWDELPQITS